MNVGEAESGVEGADLESAGWASVLSFSWLDPLFRTGAARQLRSEDLPGLSRRDKTAVWADRCEVSILHFSVHLCTRSAGGRSRCRGNGWGAKHMACLSSILVNFPR